MTNYERGRKLEYKALEIFRNMEDCIYATRTPASKSSADIVAIFRDRKTGEPRVVFAQCKYGRPSIKQEEIDWLLSMRDFGIGVLVVYKPRSEKRIYFWPPEEAIKKMNVVQPKGISRKRTMKEEAV